VTQLQQRLARFIEPTPVHAAGQEDYYYKYIVPDKTSFYSFDGHMALREPLLDESKEVVFLKGSQVGITTGLLGQCFYRLDVGSWDVQYFLPTTTLVERFTAGKVDRLITRNPHLSVMVRSRHEIDKKSKDTIEIKSFRDAFLFIKGIDSARSILSDPGDMIVFDEVDQLNQKHMKQAKDRLLHSKYGFRRYAGVGMMPGLGIDKIYAELSDKRVRVFHCPACGKDDQVLADLFPDNARQNGDGDWYFGCINCGVELDRDNDARWVAQKECGGMPGYRISALDIKAISANYIMQLYQEAEGDMTAKAVFRSTVLAIPDAGAGQPITDAVLKSCEGDYFMLPRSNYSFLGIDVGNICHLYIRQAKPEIGTPQVIHIEKIVQTNLVQRVVELDKRFRFQVVVIDRKPSLTTATQLADALGRHRVYLQEFKGSTFETSDYKPIAESNDIFKQVTMDRDIWLDGYTGMFANTDIEIPKKGEGEHGMLMEEFWQHHKALQKVLEYTSKGLKYASYRKNVENHFAFAGCFSDAAHKIWFNKFAHFTGVGIESSPFRI